MADYANPDVLVSTQWVHDHLESGIRLIEVDLDPKLYAAGHIPGAVGWDWSRDLNDPVRRDIPTQAAFELLMSEAGVAPGDTVVLYGDSSNWFAAFAFWVMKLYGHRDVRLMNGGRSKWLNEPDRPMTTQTSRPTPARYSCGPQEPGLRAFVPEVLEIARSRQATLVDVRSPDEYSGKVIAPPGMTETAQRGGHIPGARSVPWSSAVNADGTFKSADELRAIYFDKAKVDPQGPAVAYCRIGERSSHTWFVLKYLLGMRNVKNYDGSWTEYGNLVAAPIEKG